MDVVIWLILACGSYAEVIFFRKCFPTWRRLEGLMKQLYALDVVDGFSIRG